jgi:hypothetical protein
MKPPLFVKVLAGLTFCLGTNATFNQPSYAAKTTFFCGSSNGVPVTYGRTPRGNVPMIRWSSNYFPAPWTPQRRCQEVSRRFQKQYDNGTLKGLNWGKLRGQPVICAVPNRDTACRDQTLLFTLQPGSDPEQVVQKLMDHSGLASGMILNQSNGSIYIDIEMYLNNATVEETNESNFQPEKQNPENSNTPWWNQN